MTLDKTFEAIAKLQDIEIELRRLKTALVMANKAIDAAVIVEREACAKVCDDIRRMGGYSAETPDWERGTGHCADAIRARGNT